MVTESFSHPFVLLQLQVRHLLPVFHQQLLVHLEESYSSHLDTSGFTCASCFSTFSVFSSTYVITNSKAKSSEETKEPPKMIMNQEAVTWPIYYVTVISDLHIEVRGERRKMFWPWWAAVGHRESVSIPGPGSSPWSGSSRASSSWTPFCCPCHSPAPLSSSCTLEHDRSTFGWAGRVEHFQNNCSM